MNRKKKTFSKKETGKRSLEECFSITFRYLSRYQCSRMHLVDYLRRKGCAEHAETIVFKMVELGYINDEEFSRRLISKYSNRYGKTVIRNLLLKKGINRETAAKSLLDLTNEEQAKKAMKLVKDYFQMKGSHINNNEFRKKVFTMLHRRGFSYEIITVIANRLSTDIEDAD